MAKVTFYGGASSVTGANFLFESDGTRVLLDCGAEAREDICDPANHEPFVYDAKTVDALLVTHAHQDHIGRVPKLVKEGFTGHIISTPATRDISAVMFDDALSVMTYDAKRRNCEPFFDRDDVEKTKSLWETHEYHEKFLIGNTEVEFLDAGHILGSSMIRLVQNGRSVLFTGDLGNSPEPLLRDTESPAGTNFLIVESVYGDRVHEERDSRTAVLRTAIEDIRARKGTLLIPSFSIERTQILLYEIDKMLREGKMQPIPVYLDAPLATRVTEIFRKYRQLLNAEAEREAMRGDIFSFPGLEVVTNYSDEIHQKPSPKVIIAGAGMSSGGRIRSHEKKYLPDHNAGILFTGYQAPGSLGRRIQDGADSVRIDGEDVRVRAQVSTLSGYSGHRDRDGLLNFVEQAGESLERVYCVLGEPKASSFLAQRIRDFLGVEAVVPKAGESVEIAM